MAITSEQAIILERLNTEFTKEKVAYELRRRSVQSRVKMVSRWAMITRKMKKEEPSYDVLNDFTDFIRYVWELPRNVLLSTDYITNVVLLLSSSKGREAERAAWALGSIAAGDDAGKAACVSAGAVPALVSLLSSSKGREAEMAAGALWNIARGDDAGKAACVSAGAVPALVSLLSSTKGDEAGCAEEALANIAKGDAKCKAAVILVLVSLLSSSKSAERAARAFCSIASGDDECKAACVSAGAVPALVRLLLSSKGAEPEWAATALWSIAKGDAACKAVCVSATKPLLTRGDIPDRIRSIIKKYCLKTDC